MHMSRGGRRLRRSAGAHDRLTVEKSHDEYIYIYIYIHIYIYVYVLDNSYDDDGYYYYYYVH